jgi:hypothetical protein
MGRVVAVPGRFCRRLDGRRVVANEGGFEGVLFVRAVPSLKGIAVEGEVEKMSLEKLKSKPWSPGTGCSCGVLSGKG